MFANPLTERLADFICGIGIDVRPAHLPDATFLPGLRISGGVIFVDEEKLAHPGDLLHEAGHLAVTDPSMRNTPELATPSEGDEIAAIAWSYAAAKHLDIDPAIVFHEHGYRGSSKALVADFDAERTFGQPLLQYYGMTFEKRQAAENGVPPFPFMVRWLR
ncbi:hypothetical protein V5279_08815 [Bradyrhizobium sp. 26S5]|uniref:hypothetical protein n=1 Tax=Bradyrhizobium sp. 26S5 TaxID=3139729 RepID=UPI0030D544A5